MNAYGHEDKSIPRDWIEAFARLRELFESDKVYREPINNKRVLFLDELPWMDTARSDFKSALDYFWNSWASAQEDLVLIACGSATLWIITNLLTNKKGFHNRITRCIHLAPFSLAKCEELFALNDIVMTRSQMIESYMVFGGIPHYLNLFYSLYDKSEKYMAILETLARNRDGLTRAELSKEKEIGGGSVLTKDLRELEECGFIRKFINFAKGEGESFYQLIDPFTLFSISFIKNKKFDSWNEYINTPGYHSWRGNSFEIVCLNHIQQIKATLGISGIETNEFAWRSSESEKGAQIGLIIRRKDGVINFCEMKFTNEAIHITLVCGNGYKQSKYSGIVQNVILGDDLFER